MADRIEDNGAVWTRTDDGTYITTNDYGQQIRALASDFIDDKSDDR